MLGRGASEHWLEQELTGIGKFAAISEGVASSAYGPRFSSTLYSDEADYRLLRTTDMDEFGNIDYSTMPRADVGTSFDSHLLKDGDFLISRSGTCGVPGVFEMRLGGPQVIPGAFLIRLRLNDSLNPRYLRAFFNSKQGQVVTAALAHGGVQKNIRGSALLQCDIPFPSVARQECLIQDLAQVNCAYEAVTTEIRSLAALRSGLLGAIFGGIDATV